MRRLSHKLVLSLISLTCALAFTLSHSDASGKPASGAAPQSPRVDAHAPQGAPLTFYHAQAAGEPGRTVLSYSFNNSAGQRLDTVQLVALVLDAAGEVRGGQGWTVNVPSTPGEAVEGSIELAGEVRPSDYVLLTVWKAQGGSVNFTRGFSQTLKSYRRMKGFVSAAPDAPEFLKARAQQTQNTCSASLNEAKAACGCGGLKSFSCNPSTGQFSFECFPKNGCDAAPAESAN